MVGHAGSYNYLSTDKCQMVEIPYKDYSFSMYLVLPHERYGLKELLKTFDTTQIWDIFTEAKSTYVSVQIPRFTVDSSFDLVKTLKHLKIDSAFNDADFSALCSNQIYVSDFLHKSVIFVSLDKLKVRRLKVVFEVTEYGTKASAATALVSRYYMMEICDHPNPLPFVADHPFLYFIADRSKNIYFIGTYFSMEENLLSPDFYEG